MKAIKIAGSVSCKVGRNMEQVLGLRSSPSKETGLGEEQKHSVQLSPKPYDDWVECTKCKKWRLCMPHITVDDLPEDWQCREMAWLPGLNHCKYSEEETSAAVYMLLGWPASSDAGNLNGTREASEPPSALSPTCKSPLSVSPLIRKEVKGLARRIGVISGNRELTAKKIKTVSASSETILAKKKSETSIPESGKSRVVGLQKCSKMVGLQGRNKKILKRVHGTDKWQLLRPDTFGDSTVSFKEKERLQVLGESDPKEQHRFEISKDDHNLHSGGDVDHKDVKHSQVMLISPKRGYTYQFSRPKEGGVENILKKEEASFFIMNAQMEAHALKDAADGLKRMSGDKDEIAVADLYLHAGMKFLLSSRYQEEVCDGSKGEETVTKSYSEAAKIMDECCRRYEKIPDHGRAALAQIVAGLARMRMTTVTLESSNSNLESLKEAELSFRQANEDVERQKDSDACNSILPSQLHSAYTNFISTSANMYPMLESLKKARQALAMASAEAASKDNPHQQQGILEVRKVCSLAMWDDNFERLVSQVYIALLAFGKDR